MLFAQNPLEHFEINFYTQGNFFFIDFSLNTFMVYLIWCSFFTLFLWILIWPLLGKVSTLYFSIRQLFNFFLNFTKDLPVRGLRYLSLFFFLFTFIFFLNFSSLIPYNVAITGTFITTFYYSFAIFVALIIIAFINYQLEFINYFIPSGVPNLLLPFLFLIEISSFLIRPFSLSIRLFANMLAGHTLVNIFGGFSNYIINHIIWLVFLPLGICLCIMLLEIAVSLIQAYVFVVLVTIYLQDIYYLH